MTDNSKLCRYGCGMKVYWDDTIQGKLKWREVESDFLHDYPRCAQLLKEQGKDVGVLKKRK